MTQDTDYPQPMDEPNEESTATEFEPEPFPDYEATPPSREEPAGAGYPPPSEPVKGKKDNKTLIIVLVVIGVLLLCCCIAFFVLPALLGPEVENIFDEIIRNLEVILPLL